VRETLMMSLNVVLNPPGGNWKEKRSVILVVTKLLIC
jgi:hypothetical protein